MIIIDSGLNTNSSELTDKVLGGVTIEKDLITNGIIYNENIEDTNGHGTYCAETILTICPDVSFFIIKIVGVLGYTSSELLIKALEICENIDIKIICLSLSMIKDGDYENIQVILDRLNKNGKLICVSVQNGKANSIPANYSSTIGVRGKIFLDNSHYIYTGNNETAYFDSTPIFIESIDSKYIFFYGNSKANAICAGHIARLTEQYKNYTNKQIKNMLKDTSKGSLTRSCQKEIEVLENVVNKKDIDLFQELVYEFNGIKLNKVELTYISPVISLNTGISFLNFYDFLQIVKKLLKVYINYKDVNFSDTYYLGNFIKFLKGLRI